MKIKKITIHNFRSILHQELNLNDYSLLIGENNAGKSNIFRAIRVFYEDEKFNASTDFPKIGTTDKESWIEIEYITNQTEQEGLKDEYKSKDNILRVRKILHSTADKDLVKSTQSNIYAYENGQLSKNLFYGAKNISQSKLGSVIFIPELSKVDETLKLSGPSPLRSMINFVVKKAVENSDSYAELNEAFSAFNEKFRKESSDGFSIHTLTENINAEMSDWNVRVGIDINSLKSEELVKSLVSHYVEDGNLDNQRVNIDSFGQGLQRHLVYSLIKLSAEYAETKQALKKEFAPNFNLILFEEPEAFLHPTQQQKMNLNLEKLSSNDDTQLLITTHSPIFVSQNIDKLTSLIRVRRESDTKLFQLNKPVMDNLFDSNTGLYQLCKATLEDPSSSDAIKNEIKKSKLASVNDDLEIKIQEESFRYSLWIDSERSSSFFSKCVIICEGASEKVFLDLLIKTEWADLSNKNIYFIDVMGKFNIHRFMNLFGKLGISHSILLDSDNDRNVHELINNFIENSKNSFTKNIHWFDSDLEGFLGIETPGRKDLKPLNIMSKYHNKEIDPEKIKALKQIITDLIQD